MVQGRSTRLPYQAACESCNRGGGPRHRCARPFANMAHRLFATVLSTSLAAVGFLTSTAAHAAPRSLREAVKPVPVGVFRDASGAFGLTATSTGAAWLLTPTFPGAVEARVFRLDDVLFVRTRGPSWRLTVTSNDELVAIEGLPHELRLRRQPATTAAFSPTIPDASPTLEPSPADLDRMARGQCFFSASLVEARVKRGARVQQAFELCCKAGDVDSCAAVADLHSRLRHQDDEAYATLAPLCFAGSARACDAVAELEARRERPAEAHRFRQRACDRRSPTACATLRIPYMSPPASSGVEGSSRTRTEAAGSPSKL